MKKNKELYHGLYEYKRCVVCNKRFARINTKAKPRRRQVGIRRKGSVTCSHKCSNENNKKVTTKSAIKGRKKKHGRTKPKNSEHKY